MTTPDKDQVLDASATDNPGTGAPPSATDAAGQTPTGSQEPAGEAAEAVEAEVLDPEDPVAEEADESEIVAKAQAEVAEWQDKYMRLHAEWDTYRRRTNEQRAAEKALATEKLVGNLIPVLDDFERTIDYAVNNGEVGLLGGVKAVYAKLVDILVKDGVEVLNPEGEAFDALEAQAVATVPDETVPDETVAQVYQKGYRMGAKVLRPAMVTVTTGGPKREKPVEDAE